MLGNDALKIEVSGYDLRPTKGLKENLDAGDHALVWKYLGEEHRHTFLEHKAKVRANVEKAKNEGKAKDDPANDPLKCEYWRYCAFDGFLCTCCGGSVSTCPPGTEASKVSWVGTCLNPKDGRQYLVSYNDCCGKASCGECLCNNTARERPGYRLGVHNDINWCMANDNTMFHCTTSVIVGVA